MSVAELTATVERLGRELEVTRLAAEIATSVVPLFNTLVEDADERTPVIEDMVACWLSLPDDVRAGYEETAMPRCTAVVTFAQEYLELVERTFEETDPEGATSHELHAGAGEGPALGRARRRSRGQARDGGGARGGVAGTVPDPAVPVADRGIRTVAPSSRTR